MNAKTLEKIAVTGSVLILLAAAWFWSGQVQSVLDLLEMAYG